jgi:cellulose synthase/poly-beta-1,6-N-acetylglucosamine synthase-like glycosyltransferase
MIEGGPFIRPGIDVIVAVLDEATTIDRKLRELTAMHYPADRLRFLVIDGGSSDGTQALLAARAREDARIEAVFTRLADKTAQLNEGLSRSRASWVFVSDADASLPADTLGTLMRAAQADASVGVVGVPAMPLEAHPLDTCHWRLSNWIRRIEHRTGTTGLVVASGYLFRRSLVERFPDDTLADDVYVACRGAASGTRVAFVDVETIELRAAITGLDWFRHKVRRTRGYLREVFRFLPDVSRMARPEIFLWRAAALTLGPAIGAASIALAIAGGGIEIVVSAAGLALLAAACPPNLARANRMAAALPAVTLPFWTLAIATSALVTYPFVRQTAQHRKVPTRAGRVEAV